MSKYASWEAVDLQDETHRLKVPGGWIVRSRFKAALSEGGVSVHQLFLADPAHAWKFQEDL